MVWGGKEGGSHRHGVSFRVNKGRCHMRGSIPFDRPYWTTNCVTRIFDENKFDGWKEGLKKRGCGGIGINFCTVFFFRSRSFFFFAWLTYVFPRYAFSYAKRGRRSNTEVETRRSID